MRTLKKTLALVLVLAMMFSLCISAAAFDDAEEITNSLAVDTLVAMGVIDGMPDGTFNPEGTLTRAQAAKILAYLLGVGEFAADGAETGFADVPASHWASGYIAYCADAGIIAGYGDGKFGPSDELTAYQWAKMLLVAFAEQFKLLDDEGELKVSFTGSAWQINVAKYALANGLWNDKTDKTAPVSRDNACLYAYNALDLEGYAPEVAYNVYGAPVANEWYLPTDKEKETPAHAESIAPVATWTTEIAKEDVVEAMGLAEDETYTLDVYSDGEEAVKDTVFTGKLEDNWSRSGNGTVIELYNVDTNAEDTVVEFRAVIINTYVAELGEKDVVEADEKAETAAYIKLGKYTFETEEFEKDDVVLYTVGQVDKKAAVITAEKAAVAEGKITSVSNTGAFKIDGVAAEFAANNLEKSTAVASSTAKLIYTDAYGYVVNFGDVPGAPEEKPEEEELTYAYGYMTNYKSVPYTAPVEDDYWTVKDETVLEVEAVEKFQIVTAAGELVTLDGALEVKQDEKTEKWDTTFVGKDLASAQGLVKYGLNSEGLVAEIVLITADATGSDFVTGKATLTGSSALLTSDTVIFYVYEKETDGVKATVIDAYVGYLNAPSSVAGTTSVYASNSKEQVEAIAFAGAPKADEVVVVDPSLSTVYVADASYEITVAQDENGDDYFVYNYTFYVGAEEVAYKAAKNALAVEAEGMYVISTNEYGYSTVKSTIGKTEAEITAVEATYFKAGTIFYTNDATAYYTVDKDGVAVAEGIVASVAKEFKATTAYVIVADTGANAGKVAAVYYGIELVEEGK